MLKEIDLVAFGRRVHIYNAIKELKSRVASPPLTRPASLNLSPGISAYEPDSPRMMSFASPMGYQASTFDGHQGGGDLQGLGFEDDASSIVRPTSSVSRGLRLMSKRNQG